MKLLLSLAVLLGLTNTKYEELKLCIEERCPSQYDDCMDSSDCEEKLEKCADKCGLKVNLFCWSGCVGFSGPASAAALCANSQGCIDNSVSWEEVGKKIDDLIKKH